MRRKRLLLFLTFLALFFLFLRPPTDPDLGWHLRYGKMTVESLKFPRADSFSHTMADYPWANSYWLSEVIIFLGLRFLSFLGLSIVFSLLATGALFLSLASGKNWRENFFRLRTVLIIFAGVLLLLPFVGIRPQTISLFFFSLLLFLLRRVRLRWIPFLFLFWANFHAGFLLGLLALWLFFWGRVGGRAFKQGGIKLLLTAILSTLTTLINPYGLFLWRTIFKDALSPQIKRGVLEWAAPNFHTDLGLFFIFYALILVAVLSSQRRRFSFSEVFLTFAFLILSFSAIRHIPLLVVVSVPLWQRSGVLLKLPYFPPFYRLWGWTTLLGTSFFALFTFSLGLYRGHWDLYKTRGVGGYPQKAVEFLKANPQEGNVFNAYGWGGFILWNLPEVKTFIDGRMCGWRWGKEESLFSRYIKVTGLKPGWEKVLERYKVRWVFVEKEAPLSQVLAVDRSWQKVFEDNLAVIFMKSEVLE